MSLTKLENLVKYVTNAEGSQTEVLVPIALWNEVLASLGRSENGLHVEHPLVKLSGIFKDDPKFDAMMEFIKADRQALDSLWSEYD